MFVEHFKNIDSTIPKMLKLCSSKFPCCGLALSHELVLHIGWTLLHVSSLDRHVQGELLWLWKINYLPVPVHSWLLIVKGKLRFGEVVMKNRQNSSFDIQDVLWFLFVAVNLSNFPFFVFKLNWTLKKRTELFGDWGDLRWATVSWLAVSRCSIYFIQDRVSDLKGKKCVVTRTSQLKNVFRLEESRSKGQNSLTP